MSDEFEVEYSDEFAKQFDNFPEEQQDKVLDFTDIYEEFGLADFSKYPGKITPSWKNLPIESKDYDYTKSNNLWHYHMGDPEHPEYIVSISGKYKTCDRLLHFMRESDTTIVLVDVLDHYKDKAKTIFWLPAPSQLVKTED